MPAKSVRHEDVEAFVDELEKQGHVVTAVAPHEGGAYVTWTAKKSRKAGEVETR